MPKAEIITIGSEILLGEIVDTNTRTIALALRDKGIDLYWTSTVGDNPQRIANAIQLGLKRSNIIILTGGLGPTVDDPTREAVALAYGVALEYHEDLWQGVIAQFARYNKTPTENNKRQAYVPHGAIVINNPVGTAPAFIMETKTTSLLSLPGVPAEMEYLLENAVLPYLSKHFRLQDIIKTRILRTAGIGESILDEKIADLEEGSNPTLGISAHAGAVDLRITAKGKSEADVDLLIKKVEDDLRNRLGDWIFGADKDNLAGVAVKNLQKTNRTLFTLESGLNGNLEKSLTNTKEPLYLGGKEIPDTKNLEDLRAFCQDQLEKSKADVCIGAMLWKDENRINLNIIALSSKNENSFSRSYGGTDKMAPKWALSLALNFIRKMKDE